MCSCVVLVGAAIVIIVDFAVILAQQRALAPEVDTFKTNLYRAYAKARLKLKRGTLFYVAFCSAGA